MLMLPPPEAAVALHGLMQCFDLAEQTVQRSYYQRGVICREFEARFLWQYLDDPRTSKPFGSFSAWMGASGMGARSTNWEAKRDLEALADVPTHKLAYVPKQNLKTLIQLSTATRNDASVLEAARTLDGGEFVAKLAVEHPNQHLETKEPLRFMPSTSQREVIEAALAEAMKDGAGNRTEALEVIAVFYSGARILEQQLREETA